MTPQEADRIDRISEAAHESLVARQIPPSIGSPDERTLARIEWAMFSDPEAGLYFKSDRGGSIAMVVALAFPKAAHAALTALLFPNVAQAALRLSEFSEYQRSGTLPASAELVDLWIAIHAPNRRQAVDRSHFRLLRERHARFSQCARETLPILLEHRSLAAMSLDSPESVRDAFGFMDDCRSGDTVSLPVLAALSAPYGISVVLSSPENALELMAEARLAGRVAAVRANTLPFDPGSFSGP